MCLFNIRNGLLGAMCELMQRIPMKWELEGPCVTWCQGSLSTASSLVVKGVPHHPLMPTTICAVCGTNTARQRPVAFENGVPNQGTWA